MLRRLVPNREAVIMLAFSGVNGVAALIANRVVTQAITPEQLGKFYLLMNLVVWLTLPARSTNFYLLRHWAVARAYSLTRHFVRGVLEGIGLQAILAALGVAAFAAAGLDVGGWIGGAWLAVVCVGNATLQTAGVLPTADRRRVTAGIVSIASTSLPQYALAWCALRLGMSSGESVLRVQAVCFAVVALGVVAWCVRLARQSDDAIAPPSSAVKQLSARGALSYSLPFGLTLVVGAIAASVERWGLARLANPAATGLFVQSVSLSTMVTMAPISIFGNYYYPIVAELAATSDDPLQAARGAIRRYFVLTAAAVGALALGTAVFARWLTPVLFGPRFAAVATLLPWTMLGCAFLGMASVYSVFAHAARETISVNLARFASKLVYLVLLLSVARDPQPALVFAHRFVMANAIHLALMVVLTHRYVIGPARLRR